MVMFYGDDAAVLTGAVVQLPAPDAMAEGTAPYHSLFSPESESSHASGKRPAPRGPGKSKAPPAKKQRKPPKKAIFTFNLSSSTPAMIKIALANIMQETQPEPSGGTVGADKPSDGGKTGDGDLSGDKSASPSAEAPVSSALEDKPPAPKGGVNLAGTSWASKSG
ncbi:hypothetical protein PF007_g20161 [Phytophthora fragariae]|uniref:Uncharacterized protein n=1 Tax=Phytophthora fragariae TaxID=53985 RepID=A0A6A3R2N3_9STRA|nr:hypothetical protein PF007_g20161 [Phytophthora fragariae]